MARVICTVVTPKDKKRYPSPLEHTNKHTDMSDTHTHIHKHMYTLQMNKMNIQKYTRFYFGKTNRIEPIYV